MRQRLPVSNTPERGSMFKRRGKRVEESGKERERESEIQI